MLTPRGADAESQRAERRRGGRVAVSADHGHAGLASGPSHGPMKMHDSPLGASMP